MARAGAASAGEGGNARKLPYWRDLLRLGQDQELVEMEPQQSIETPPQERTEGAPEAPRLRRVGVGELLRQKRESFRQDLFTVAGQLHIRLSYLKAIEDGRFRDLPGLTYASGFVRSYSDYLGLDGEEMVRRFRAEVAGMDRQVQLIFPSLATEGKIPSGAILLLSGFLAVIAYGVWYYMADRQKSFLDLVPEVPAQLRALLGQEVPANSPPGGSTTKPVGVASATPPMAHPQPVAPPPPPPPPATSVLVNPGDLPPLPGELNAFIAAADAAPSPASGSANAAVATNAPAPTTTPGPTPVASAAGGRSQTPVPPASLDRWSSPIRARM